MERAFPDTYHHHNLLLKSQQSVSIMSTIKRKACIVIELPKVAYTLSQNSEKSVNTVDLRINAQSVFNFFSLKFGQVKYDTDLASLDPQKFKPRFFQIELEILAQCVGQHKEQRRRTQVLFLFLLSYSEAQLSSATEAEQLQGLFARGSRLAPNPVTLILSPSERNKKNHDKLYCHTIKKQIQNGVILSFIFWVRFFSCINFPLDFEFSRQKWSNFNYFQFLIILFLIKITIFGA